MQDLSVFITIHDQNLLLGFEQNGKFKDLGCPYVYVFVGRGDTSRLAGLSNVVIARELPDHIEDYKYLVDFTAWYALIKNTLIQTRYAALIQYDTSISTDFAARTQDLMRAHPNAILGYAPHTLRSVNFLANNIGAAPLHQAIKTLHNLGIYNLVNQHMAQTNDLYWPSTNNVCFERDMLADFVQWFTPIGLKIGNIPDVGHSFERAIKIYSILKGVGNIYAPDLLQHFQLNSHETQNHEKDMPYYHDLMMNNKTESKEEAAQRIKWAAKYQPKMP